MRPVTMPLAITLQVTATLLTTPIQDLSIAGTTVHVGLRGDTNPGVTIRDGITTDAITTDATGDSKKGDSAERRGPPERNSRSNSLLLESRTSLLIS
jgi:hypothetical protein